MKKMFCPYCWEPLEDGCDCAREAAEAEVIRLKAKLYDLLIAEKGEK